MARAKSTSGAGAKKAAPGKRASTAGKSGAAAAKGRGRAAAAREVEPLPEADRLEDFMHPRHTARLFGHEEAEARLAAGFTNERQHHAWLICGARGIGKATLAYRFARFALDRHVADVRGADGAPDIDANHNDANHSDTNHSDAGPLAVSAHSIAARQVAALSHPGLLLLRRVYDPKAKRFSATIPVDEIRKLRSFMNHKADVGAWRVVIVDSADELNISAANALLKSLEEPPARTLFLLITAQPGRLLPTIRSRCRRLDLAPLPSDPLRRATLQALEAAEMGREDADLGRLEPLAQGSVRQLLTLRAGGGLQLHNQCLALLGGLPNMDWGQVHKLADELGSVAAAQRFDTFFEMLFGLIARAVRAGAVQQGQAEDMKLARLFMGAPGGDPADRPAGAQGSGQACMPGPGSTGAARLASWAGLWETMQREKDEALGLNLDRKALVLQTMSQIEQLARGHNMRR